MNKKLDIETVGNMIIAGASIGMTAYFVGGTAINYFKQASKDRKKRRIHKEAVQKAAVVVLKQMEDGKIDLSDPANILNAYHDEFQFQKIVLHESN